MKLYYSPGACSMASHIALNETGLKFETEVVNMKTKTVKAGDFTKINPKGKVPTLVLDDGQILTEGAVILQYIGDQKPESKIVPKFGTMERYRCQEWLNFIASEVHTGFSPLWNPNTPEETKKTSIQNLGKRFELLSQHFAQNQYLLGNTYSVADTYLFTVLGWSDHLKIDLTPWKNILGFMERVKNRPATMAAMKTEGLLN